jgi:hypothetical protein
MGWVVQGAGQPPATDAVTARFTWTEAVQWRAIDARGHGMLRPSSLAVTAFGVTLGAKNQTQRQTDFML